MKKTAKRKVTKHAKIRIKERGNEKIKSLTTTNKNIKMLATNAVKNGMSLDTYNNKNKEQSNFKSYLNYKVKNKSGRLFLYNDYIFIFDSKVINLITMYPIPEKFLEIYKKTTKTKYELLFKDRNIKKQFNHIGYFNTKQQAIDFAEKVHKKGYASILKRIKVKEIPYLEITEQEKQRMNNILNN